MIRILLVFFVLMINVSEDQGYEALAIISYSVCVCVCVRACVRACVRVCVCVGWPSNL